jgi:hypothetical protein
MQALHFAHHSKVDGEKVLGRECCFAFVPKAQHTTLKLRLVLGYGFAGFGSETVGLLDPIAAPRRQAVATKSCIRKQFCRSEVGSTSATVSEMLAHVGL